jgi:hypothetical protein
VAKELEQSAHPLPDTWRKRYAEKGLLGINSPSEYGGASRRAARLGGVRAHFRFGCLEARAPIERADLHVVLGIVFVARQFLYGDVLRVRKPSSCSNSTMVTRSPSSAKKPLCEM